MRVWLLTELFELGENKVNRCTYFAARIRLLVLAISIVPLGGCDKAAGIAAVKELCAKDGGETIYERTFVPGYLAPGSVDCLACKALPKKEFEYIDVFVEPGRGYREITGPGYYRYFVSSVGDRRCDFWEKDPQFLLTKSSWGFRSDQCLAVEPITVGISNYSWTRVQKAVPGPEGIEIGSDEFTIFQIEPHRVLARHKDYTYTSKLTRFLGSIEAGGANPDVHCSGRIGPWVNISGLLQRVLRDETKKPDQIGNEERR